MKRCRQLRISMWRHEAARVYITVIFHVRALDAAVGGGQKAKTEGSWKYLAG